MLAHVSPPRIIFEFRSFDVPLMSFLMGMSFMLSSRKKNASEISYSNYINKRFKRLIIPALVFITFFLFVMYIGSQILSINFPYTISDVLNSYTLLSGIGYVWIIRVFFLISLLSPFILRTSLKFKSTFSKTVFIFILLSLHFLVLQVGTFFHPSLQFLYDEIIATTVGYGIAALIGMWAVNQTHQENIQLSAYFFLIFIVMGYINNFDLLSSNKYPPTIYFITYGIGLSLLLFFIFSHNKIRHFFSSDITQWLSAHSLEIYYWHIFPVVIINSVIPELNWILQYIIVILFALLATYLQLKFIPGFFNLRFSTAR